MANWENLFAQFSDVNVLVIGDLMLDSYVFGRVDRISPEAPVPVVSVQSREDRLGGAANVALNLKRLGGKVEVASVVGNDKSGHDLIELLNAEGISTAGIVTSKDRTTTVKQRIIGNSAQMMRVDEENLNPLYPSEYELMHRWIIENIHRFNIILFEDYDKGVITPDLIHNVVALANQNDIPTVVDPKKNNFLSYKGVTLFKPNLKEIKEGLNLTKDLSNEQHLISAVQELQNVLSATYVMVTLSERGVVMTDGKEYLHIPAHLRSISDVSGAGDTVISVAAMCLACKASIWDIAFLSNLAGGLVCEQIGVVPIDKDQLLKEANKLG